VECEIHVPDDLRDQHLAWVRSLSGTEVTAHGVWVNDTGRNHHDKTELHPLDVVFGPVTASFAPGDWIGALATQRGLVVGATMLAFRFAAASDNRGNFFNRATPPLSRQTRPTTFTVPFPPRPDGSSVARSEQRTFLVEHASIESADPEDRNGTTVQPVTTTCLDRDHGGPGILLGELVTYWAAPGAPAVAVDPVAIDFPTIAAGNSVTRQVTIANIGQADLAVTIAGSPFPSFFSWADVNTHISPGGSFQLAIEFAPPEAGERRATVIVESNAPGSPPRVALHGKAQGGPN
jgi:Abnormal spindle-like microcephaly-assoc'd, ASPM-SPD-2-Hydin